jgi:DNA-binding NarL/FixJ family response regulator
MGKIRVLVVSDYQMVRSGLRQLLKIDEAFDALSAEASIGKGLSRLCHTLSPDVLLVSVGNDDPSSLRVLVKLLAVVPQLRILIVGASEGTTYPRAVLAAGAMGYILKAATQSELFQAVKQVSRGRRYMDPRLEPSLSDPLLSPVPEPKGKDLSRREMEVLRAIALGFTTREISKELDLSEKTVQTYRERIYKKLELRTRADLVHYALAHGLAGWDKPM